jgi:hypothetical protein
MEIKLNVKNVAVHQKGNMEVVEESYVTLYQALCTLCSRAVKFFSQVIITIKVKFIWYVIINTKNLTHPLRKPNFEVYSRIKRSLVQYDLFYFLLNTLYRHRGSANNVLHSVVCVAIWRFVLTGLMLKYEACVQIS